MGNITYQLMEREARSVRESDRKKYEEDPCCRMKREDAMFAAKLADKVNNWMLGGNVVERYQDRMGNQIVLLGGELVDERQDPFPHGPADLEYRMAVGYPRDEFLFRIPEAIQRWMEIGEKRMKAAYGDGPIPVFGSVFHFRNDLSDHRPIEHVCRFEDLSSTVAPFVMHADTVENFTYFKVEMCNSPSLCGGKLRLEFEDKTFHCDKKGSFDPTVRNEIKKRDENYDTESLKANLDESDHFNLEDFLRHGEEPLWDVARAHAVSRVSRYPSYREVHPGQFHAFGSHHREKTPSALSSPAFGNKDRAGPSTSR